MGTSLVGQLAIALFMLQNGSRKRFPQFFYYSVFGAIQTLVLWAIMAWGTYPQYFYTYWATSAGFSILGFLVIQEVFLTSLRTFDGLRDLGKIAFRWAGAVMIIVAIISGLNGRTNSVFPIQRVVGSFESCIRLIEVGLLVLLFCISGKVGLSTKSRTFGIAVGMFVMAAVNLVSFSILSNTGMAHLLLINQVRAGFGIAVMLTWLAYFALPAAQEKPVMVPIASPLMRWNEIAMAFGHSSGRVVYTDSSEPFLPQVERMVDRIFETGEMKG